MDSLSVKLIIASAAVLVFAASGPANADPFQYTPYNGRNNTGQPDQGPPPDNYSQPPVAGSAAAPSPPPAAYDARQAGAPSRDGGPQRPDPDADSDDNYDGPPASSGNRSPAPRGAYSPSEDVYSPSGHGVGPAPPPPGPSGDAGPPPDGALARVEVQVAAPDDGVPSGVREHDARRAAIQGWRSKVSERYGPEFSQWRFAAGKHVDCHPDRRDGLICIASAQPVRGFDRYGQGPRDGRY